MTPKLNIGDYVLATKYTDGDAGDAWAVGFIADIKNGRYYVAHKDGQLISTRSYGRAKRISAEYGAWLLHYSNRLELDFRYSLWGRKIQKCFKEYGYDF